MFIDKNKIESLILELDLVNQDDFDLAKQEAEEKNIETSQVLCRKGIINEQELQNIQMKVAGISFVDLSKQKIDSSVLTIIPEPIVRQYNIIAFAKDDKNLKIAILDLDNLEKIDFLRKIIGLRIVPYLTDKISLNKAILQYQELLKNEYGTMIQKGFLSFQTFSEDSLKGLSREAILELSRSKQVNSVFELLIKHSLIQKVSNIHIEPQEDNVLIRYRIDGVLYPAMVLPKKSAIILALKIKTLAGMKMDVVNLSQEGRFQLGFDGKEVDFRVHIIPSLWGERIVLNILQAGDSGFSLEAVGFHGKALDVLYSNLNKKKKMLLIAGSQQSGRTTTFYTILDLLKNPNLNIITIENLIGFQMTGISQIVTKPEIGFGILEGIEQLSKQDCDVIAVDEIENLNLSESVKCFSRLSKIVDEEKFVSTVVETKMNSSAEIVFKLINTNRLNSTLIINGLGVVILQKLVPKLSNERPSSSVGRQEYYLNVSEIKKISKNADLKKTMSALVNENVLVEKKAWSEIKFFKSIIEKDSSLKKGTQNGQIMVSEVLKISPAIKELMLKKATANEIGKQAEKEGMLTLAEEVIFRAVQGMVPINEVLK